MNNFLTRTFSGAVFVALIVGSILSCQYAFALLFAIICVWAVSEFHKLTNNTGTIYVNPIMAGTGSAILFIATFLKNSELTNLPVYSIYGLYIAICIISELYKKQGNHINNWGYFILGQLMVSVPFSLLNFILFINNWQPLLLLSVFVTIWVNDTGAYLVGVSFGKHRLFERISPKKSWEGFFGGATAALISGYIFSLFIPEISLLNWMILSEIIVIAATFGDLTESLLKRTVNVKDSGNVIPGHGGILDRFDSMLLAAPIVYIYLSFIFHNF